jgi:hypothetical protein
MKLNRGNGALRQFFNAVFDDLVTGGPDLALQVLGKVSLSRSHQRTAVGFLHDSFSGCCVHHFFFERVR